MRAAVFDAFGDPDVLRVAELDPPGPPTGDRILVRVHASSVNGTDLGLRRGDLKAATWGRKPFVPGFDLAGEVVACGPRVTAFEVGDRVMALLGHGGGGQAEYVVLGQRRAARVPASLSSAQAAAVPLAGLTALQALHGRAALRTRVAPRVLVHGATGGIGSYAVQLARLAGAHVTATARPGKQAYARELGAHHVVEPDQAAATPDGFDVVLDTPGVLPLGVARALLRAGGVLVSTRPIGATALRALLPRRPRRGEPRVTAVMTSARSQDLALLATMVESGRLRVPLEHTYPLDQVAAAHREVEGTTARGKVVVTLDPDAG